MKNKILAAGIFILPVALFLYFWWSPGALHENATKSDATQSSSVQADSPTPAAPAKPALPNPTGKPVSSAGATASTPSVNPTALASATASVALPVAPGVPHEPEFTNFPPEIVLQKVAHAMHDYASMFGSNPVGTNPEITAALNGKNPRQANFINPEDGMRINGNGELVDAWGTPYFFHQLSGTDMEIHSAGPDRVMWTADDLVSH